MALIIDGYNVIFAMLHRLPRFDSEECERLRTDLLRRLEHYRVIMDEAITVVFDGGPGGAHLARLQHFGGLTVIFSDPKSDADREIKSLVSKSSGARDLHVVTDDNELARDVKRQGTKVYGTADLMRKMERAENRRGEEEAEAEPEYKFSGPASYEVDDWVRTFEALEDEVDLDEDLEDGDEEGRHAE